MEILSSTFLILLEYKIIRTMCLTWNMDTFPILKIKAELPTPII